MPPKATEHPSQLNTQHRAHQAPARKPKKRKAYLPDHHAVTVQRHLNLVLYFHRIHPDDPLRFDGLLIEVENLVKRDNLRCLIIRLPADSVVGQALQARFDAKPIRLPSDHERYLRCLVTLDDLPEPTAEDTFQLILRPMPT